jgi:hypothetical protein
MNQDTSKKLTAKLIRRFRNETSFVSNYIDFLIKNGEYKLAQEKLNRLRDSSQRIGANELCMAAESLNQCLEKDIVDQFIYLSFQEKLQETIKVINWVKISVDI